MSAGETWPNIIVHSVNHILQTEFGETLGSEGVHIIDPFTGTGTFITRLLQSGLIGADQIEHKYRHEIHANEIVLLAYYIAAINIEAVYHGIVGGDYQPFEGICLTDTFQMYEKDDLIDALLVDNSKRRKRQKNLDIRVIIGNPPYSVGQKSENDNNDNVQYPHLDSRIRNTYAAKSDATLSKGLYDSYVRAIRWASDRVGDAGVIGFVTNAGFLDANTADGLRQSLVDEFSSLYIFHLRGNARTSGEMRRKEKDNVFGSGSRAPIAISLLVKNPGEAAPGQIYFHDIGDYLSREEKLERIASYGGIAGISAADAWQSIAPDGHGDWLKQRDDSFNCYNDERQRFTIAHGLDKKKRHEAVDGFINNDSARIAWSRALKNDLTNDKVAEFEMSSLVIGTYRPFCKQWFYFNRRFNEVVYKMPRFFPYGVSKNIIIGVSASESRSVWSVFISDNVSSLHAVDMVGSQYFPLYLYDDRTEANVQPSQGDMFSADKPSHDSRIRRDAITDEGLAHFQTAYPGESLVKEDIFYYVYGLLHSPDYRQRFGDNLGKDLPRMPCVTSAVDFWTFSRAGRALAELHLNYETVPMYAGAKIESDGKLTGPDYRVEKMRHGKQGKQKDLTTVIYNNRITVTGIPLKAYEYVVNGKPAIEWVMERQCIKTDKASGIISDANDWATETMGNARYPLELLLRVVTVSLETVRIVESLPGLEI